MKHTSVLKKEAIELLNIKEDGIYLDLTLGRGGHSSEILKRLKSGRLIAFDLDKDAINESDPLLKSIGNNYQLIHDNFKNFPKYLDQLNIKNVDGILIDLGVSSPQFDDAKRGFSYSKNAPLDMRMNQDQSLTAADIVNSETINKLTFIFREYGEEKYAYQIARKIYLKRAEKRIETTIELADLICDVKKNSHSLGHPAKQAFQALRIAVNDELNNLSEVLTNALQRLNTNGRLVVISFHSLEDRIVKNAFNSVCKLYGDRNDLYELPKKIDINYSLITKKVIIPTDKEIEYNHRAKSAKLRAIERL